MELNEVTDFTEQFNTANNTSTYLYIDADQKYTCGKSKPKDFHSSEIAATAKQALETLKNSVFPLNEKIALLEKLNTALARYEKRLESSINSRLWVIILRFFNFSAYQRPKYLSDASTACQTLLDILKEKVLVEESLKQKQSEESVHALCASMPKPINDVLSRIKVHERYSCIEQAKLWRCIEGYFTSCNDDSQLEPNHSISDAHVHFIEQYLGNVEDLLNDSACLARFVNGLKAYNILKLDYSSTNAQELDELLKKGYWYFTSIVAESGTNLLHKAAMLNKRASYIPILIANGLDPNTPDFQGNTALHWAVANASEESATVLLKNEKCNPNLQDWGYNKQTPLQLAIAKGRRNSNWDRLVTALIARTSEINAPNINGDTALHLAFARRDIEFINALITNKADPMLCNKKGQRPEDLWHLSSEEAWIVVDGSKCTTSWDMVSREQADISKIFYL